MSYINRIGRIGKINLKANREIRKQVAVRRIEKCEIGLEGCMPRFALCPAHRHKRIWYSGRYELLWHISQWLIGCPVCHNQIEGDKELTEEVFLRLRGNENITDTKESKIA